MKHLYFTLIFLALSKLTLGQVDFSPICGQDEYRVQIETAFPKFNSRKPKGKVKSIANINPNGTIYSFSYFNSNGTQRYYVHNNQDTIWKNHTYDNKENLISITGLGGNIKDSMFYKNNKLVKKRINHNIGWSKFFTSNDSIFIGNKITTIKYDWNGEYNYTKQIIGSNGKIEFTYIVELNDNNQIKKITTTNSRWSNKFRNYKYAYYYPNGNLKEIIQEDDESLSSQDFYSKETYHYDKLNRLTSVKNNTKTKFDSNENSIQDLIEIQYLTDNSLTILQKRYIDNRSSDLVIKYYNKNRNLTKSYSIGHTKFANGYSRPTFSEGSFKYKYDERGNWITIKYWQDKATTPEITKRIITYYD